MNASVDPKTALLDALKPGALIDHQDKVWRMGQVQVQGGTVVGRLGFQAADLAELWDDDLQDFTELSRATGLVSPFAITLEEYPFRVAFQVRGRRIQAGRFVQVLEALMNEAAPYDRWRVSRELRKQSFGDWTREVDRVTLIKATLRRPNPHYADRDRVRELVEGTKAHMAEVILRADADDLRGIDVDDPFVRQAIDHAARGYGTFAAVGARDKEQVQWTSKDEGAVEMRRVPADPVTRDVSASALRHELGDPTVHDEELDEAREALASARAEEEPDDELLLEDLEVD